MRFSTDHYFQIGYAHYTAGKPCQDYALSRSNGIIACAIVSDGCSTGGNTDVGARVLTFGTLQAIRDHAKTSEGSLDTAAISIFERQQQIIEVARAILGFDQNDMLATSVSAYLTQKGALVYIQGDGIIGIKYRNGLINMHRFDWTKNAPFYPSYDNEDAMQYILNLHEGNAARAIMSHVSLTRNLDGVFTQEEIFQIPFQEGQKGISLKISAEILSTIDFIAVFTDGVSQIGKLPNGDNPLDWKDAIAEFLAFKNSAGEFAKRRMIRGIKDLNKIGKGPIDDISYAVVHIKENDNIDIEEKMS